MAVRNDITVEWDVSPRIITVAAPSTEITVRDLQDTLRSIEMSDEGMLYPSLRACSGNQDLGGGTKVGLTLELKNAKLAFEARSGPDWVLCTISGGNLVAKDADGNSMDCRQPTAYVSVDRASSSSGTVQELSSIQYSSFGGAVHIDFGSSYTGTDFPNGTPQAPVNNWGDALFIARSRGFDTFHIAGSAEVDSGLDFTGFSFEGVSALKTTLTVASEALVTDCHFRNATVTGVLDHNAWLEDCEVGNLTYMEGRLIRCALEGVLTIGGNGALLIDCYSTRLHPSEVGVIDLDGAHNCAVHSYSGHLEIRNMTGGVVGISFTQGHLTIDNTVTGGFLHVMGSPKIVNNGTATLHDEYVTNPVTLARAVRTKIYLDTVNGTTGTNSSIGSAAKPCKTLADAFTIANTLGIREISFVGEITLDRPVSNFKFSGYQGVQASTLNLNGQLLDVVAFEECTVEGELNATHYPSIGERFWIYETNIEFWHTYLRNITNLEGDGHWVQIFGTNTICPEGVFSVDHLIVEGDTTFFDLQNVARTCFSADIDSGWAQFQNVVDGCVIELNVKGGEVSLDASCTGGEFYTEGIGTVYNDSAMHTKENHFPLDEPLAYHQIEGSEGILLPLLAEKTDLSTSGGGLTQEQEDVLYDLQTRLATLKALTDDIADEALGAMTLDFTNNLLTYRRRDGTLLKTFSLTRTATTAPTYIGRTPNP